MSLETPYKLVLTGGIDHQWTSDSGNIISDKSFLKIAPAESSTYYLNSTDSNGCLHFDTVKIEVTNVDSNASNLFREMFVPNAFHPSGDNLLTLIAKGTTEFFFSIYNRLGHLIFESNNPDVYWDGTYKGKSYRNDVLIYHLRVRYGTKSDFTKQGTITLVN